jgi:hypothetical protein
MVCNKLGRDEKCSLGFDHKTFMVIGRIIYKWILNRAGGCWQLMWLWLCIFGALVKVVLHCVVSIKWGIC